MSPCLRLGNQKTLLSVEVQTQKRSFLPFLVKNQTCLSHTDSLLMGMLLSLRAHGMEKHQLLLALGHLDLQTALTSHCALILEPDLPRGS